MLTATTQAARTNRYTVLASDDLGLWGNRIKLIVEKFKRHSVKMFLENRENSNGVDANHWSHLILDTSNIPTSHRIQFLIDIVNDTHPDIIDYSTGELVLWWD